MARKSHEDALGVAGAETIIGTGVVLEGQLDSQSDISIDGRLTGSISTLGDVTIGVNAVVKANVAGANVTVAGHLTGNITASGEAIIRETGQVQGNITSLGLSINQGGVFIGRNIMQAPETLGKDADSEIAEPSPPDTPPAKSQRRKL